MPIRSLLFAVCLAAAARYPIRAAELQPPKDLAQAKGMALHVTAALQRQAERLESQGRPAGLLGRAFAIKAGLTDDEAEALGRVAARMRDLVAPLDQRAREIILAARQKYPGGRLAPGETPPPPPPELAVLQRQRDAIVEQAVRDLDRELGPTGAAKLNSHLEKTMLSKRPAHLPVRVPAQIGPSDVPVANDSWRKEKAR